MKKIIIYGTGFFAKKFIDCAFDNTKAVLKYFVETDPSCSEKYGYKIMKWDDVRGGG